MKKGWQTINNKNYYFDNEGKMAVGIKVINSTTYYFNNNGQLELQDGNQINTINITLIKTV